MKYSIKFEKDWDWFVKYKEVFNFHGKSPVKFIETKEGLSAKECFQKFDSKGIKLPCCEIELLNEILICKGSINLNIKMWAEDRAKGILPKIEFDKICKEYELLDWMIQSVEIS